MTTPAIFRNERGLASVAVADATASVERVGSGWVLWLQAGGDLGLFAVPTEAATEREALVRGLAVLHAVEGEIRSGSLREILGSRRYAKAIPPRIVIWLREHADASWQLAMDLDPVARLGS